MAQLALEVVIFGIGCPPGQDLRIEQIVDKLLKIEPSLVHLSEVGRATLQAGPRGILDQDFRIAHDCADGSAEVLTNVCQEGDLQEVFGASVWRTDHCSFLLSSTFPSSPLWLLPPQ